MLALQLMTRMMSTLSTYCGGSPPPIIVFRPHRLVIAFKYNITMVPTTTPTYAEKNNEFPTHKLGGLLCRRTGHCIGKTGTLPCRKTKIFDDERHGNNNNNIIVVPTF